MLRRLAAALLLLPLLAAPATAGQWTRLAAADEFEDCAFAFTGPINPGDLTAIEGGDDVFAVLEINAGLAARYGIAAGSELRHPAFAGGPPAWPC